ncbi:MAG: hypothetical protein WCG45_04755 [bacterium]
MLIQIILNFFIGILIGVLLEFSFRSIEEKKLIMPKLIDCQMYGLIATFLTILYFLHISLVFKLILMFIIPTLIEFATGYLYFKIKKVHLWDYKEEKYNFMELVCPLFSFFWFIISLLYYFLFLPFIVNLF